MNFKVYLIKFTDRKTNIEYQVTVPIGYGSVVEEEKVEVERQEVDSSKIEKILISCIVVISFCYL